jgi:hypothetical protein
MKSEWGRDEARRIYAIARPTYHALVTSTVDPIVGWTGQVPPAITS